MRLIFPIFVVVLGTIVVGCAASQCGKKGPRSRVVGGHEAARGEWPWQVYLKHQRPGSASYSSCGGTIISKDWVVTAAHCVAKDSNPSSYTVTVGEHNVNRKDPYEVKHRVASIIKHSGYVGDYKNYNDIALLKMATPIAFNVAVGPACLPKAGENHEGKFCHISGWGFTMKSSSNQWDEKLQTVGSKILQFADCQRRWRTIKQKTQICFGDGTVGGCMGDSGGPISCESADGNYEVVGVTSYGDGRCTVKGTPAVWTKVSGYVSWIHRQTGLGDGGETGEGGDDGGPPGGGDGGGDDGDDDGGPPGGGGGDDGGPPTRCRDRATNCEGWADLGRCEGETSDFMRAMCPKACHYCQ